MSECRYGFTIHGWLIVWLSGCDFFFLFLCITALDFVTYLNVFVWNIAGVCGSEWVYIMCNFETFLIYIRSTKYIPDVSDKDGIEYKGIFLLWGVTAG